MDKGELLWAAATTVHHKHGDRLKELTGSSLNLTQHIMHYTQEGIVVMDARGVILEVNPAFCQLSELDEAQLRGQHITNISGGIYRRRYYRDIWQQLFHQQHWQGEVVHYNHHGSLVTHTLMLHLVKDHQGQVEHIIGMINDVSQLKQSEQQLSFLAHHDALTGTANRTALLSWFSKATSQLLAHESLALLFIDLDRFKPVNDNFGHGVGDLVLKELAGRLQAYVNDNELLARIGGDEFIIIYRDTSTVAQLENKAEHLLNQLKMPVKVGHYELSVGASIGVSFYPEHGQDIDSLLRYADSAMYQAKRYSDNKVCFFDHDQYAHLKSQQRLTSDIEHAIAGEQFFLQYQPIYRTQDQQLFSLEALLRWRHPKLGVLYPKQFLPAAAAAGALYRLAEWVFVEAARQLNDWRQHSGWQGGVSVNLSGLELEYLKAGSLISLLEQQGVNPSDFTLELGCDYVMRRSESLHAALTQLRATGIKIYLNKVGAGRFNFDKFNQVPIDGIKLDRQLFTQGASPFSQSVIRALLLLSKSLFINVIACGVETQAQWQFLHEHGCYGVQGRLWAAPMHADELASYLSE